MVINGYFILSSDSVWCLIISEIFDNTSEQPRIESSVPTKQQQTTTII